MAPPSLARTNSAGKIVPGVPRWVMEYNAVLPSGFILSLLIATLLSLTVAAISALYISTTSAGGSQVPSVTREQPTKTNSSTMGRSNRGVRMTNQSITAGHLRFDDGWAARSQLP